MAHETAISDDEVWEQIARDVLDEASALQEIRLQSREQALALLTLELGARGESQRG